MPLLYPTRAPTKMSEDPFSFLFFCRRTDRIISVVGIIVAIVGIIVSIVGIIGKYLAIITIFVVFSVPSLGRPGHHHYPLATLHDGCGGLHTFPPRLAARKVLLPPRAQHG
jgi:hypothetical protein